MRCRARATADRVVCAGCATRARGDEGGGTGDVTVDMCDVDIVRVVDETWRRARGGRARELVKRSDLGL